MLGIVLTCDSFLAVLPDYPWGEEWVRGGTCRTVDSHMDVQVTYQIVIHE